MDVSSATSSPVSTVLQSPQQSPRNTQVQASESPPPPPPEPAERLESSNGRIGSQIDVVV